MYLVYALYTNKWSANGIHTVDKMTRSLQLCVCGWNGDETTFYITSKVAGSDK